MSGRTMTTLWWNRLIWKLQMRTWFEIGLLSVLPLVVGEVINFLFYLKTFDVLTHFTAIYITCCIRFGRWNNYWCLFNIKLNTFELRVSLSVANKTFIFLFQEITVAYRWKWYLAGTERFTSPRFSYLVWFW